ncbi:MAG: succinate dehydrogenase cytochrome b subunit [Bradymonadia bacterium]
MSVNTLKFYNTTIGKKIVMALSGAILLGFVFSHMAGNLLIFAGEAALNDYALSLRQLLGGAGIWVARLVLIGAVFAHVWSALQLTSQNRSARKQAYKRVPNQASTAASKSMAFGGIAILLYIAYHLAHLTFGVIPGGAVVSGQPAGLDMNVYQNIVKSFSIWWISAIYLVAQVFLGLHLYHGAWSFMQTLGVSHPRYDAYRKQFAGAFSALVCIGFAIVPIAVITGWVK